MMFIDLLTMLFPLIGLLLLLISLKKGYKTCVVISLWLSLIALILHYQVSGGELLGTYFTYSHAFIYSLNLLVLLASLIYLVLGAAKETKKRGFYHFSFVLMIGAFFSLIILLGNLWRNAQFLEDRMPGTPLLQVATFKKLTYCDYRYVFYKINRDGQWLYMCPNHYWIFPSTGQLDKIPEYLLKQFPSSPRQSYPST